MRKAYHSRLGHLDKQKRIGNICENRKDAELKNDKKEMMIEKRRECWEGAKMSWGVESLARMLIGISRWVVVIRWAALRWTHCLKYSTYGTAADRKWGRNRVHKIAETYVTSCRRSKSIETKSHITPFGTIHHTTTMHSATLSSLLFSSTETHLRASH